MNNDLATVAAHNFKLLGLDHYPGRGIIIGVDAARNNLIQVYWIMGRSENSQNHIFVQEPGGILKTAAARSQKSI